MSKRPRIVFGTWARVSPLAAGPALHGVTAVKRFDTEAGALAHMVGQGFQLPQYVLSNMQPPASAKDGLSAGAEATTADATEAPRRRDLPDLTYLLDENEFVIAEVGEERQHDAYAYLCVPLALLYNALKLSDGTELEQGRVKLKAALLQLEVGVAWTARCNLCS